MNTWSKWNSMRVDRTHLADLKARLVDIEAHILNLQSFVSEKSCGGTAQLLQVPGPDTAERNRIRNLFTIPAAGPNQLNTEWDFIAHSSDTYLSQMAKNSARHTCTL
jgi:hypothetical protein